MKYLDIYHAVRQYILNKGAQEDFERLKKIFQNCNAVDLSQTGRFGSTHLHNAIFAPFHFLPNETELAAELSLNLYNLIINRCDEINDSNLTKTLLTCPDQHNYSPLMTLLRNNNPKVLARYFEDLQLAIIRGQISTNAIKEMFCAVNDNQHSPIHEAVLGANGLNLNVFLQFLTRNQYIFAASYQQIVTTTNKFGATAVQMCMRSQNVKCKQLMFDFMHNIVNLGFITKDDYANLITADNVDKFNALLFSVSNHDPRITSLYLDEIMFAYSRKIIKPETYKIALIGKDPLNNSAIRYANQSSFETFEHYLTAVEQDYLQYTISDVEFHDFLMGAKKIPEMAPKFSKLFLEIAKNAWFNKVLTQTEYQDLTLKFKTKSTLLQYQNSKNSNVASANNNVSQQQNVIIKKKAAKK